MNDYGVIVFLWDGQSVQFSSEFSGFYPVGVSSREGRPVVRGGGSTGSIEPSPSAASSVGLGLGLQYMGTTVD